MTTAGLGDLSYLVGDDAAGVAAVVDPQIDVERYIEAARRHGLAITHILQTHVHEDFVSGARALAERMSGATVYASGEDNEPYGYACRLVRDGDRFELGNTLLTARHTPGHTPEHMAFLVAERQHAEAPYAVLSGGSLLVEAAGRTDLLGEDAARALTDAQHRTLQAFYARLPDHVIVHPTHAHGSPCGASIGDRFTTTIGYEKRFNPYLRERDPVAFARLALGDLPPKPRYYPRIKRINRDEPPRNTHATQIPALPAADFGAAIAKGNATLLDTRHMLAFGGAHVRGALNIGAAPQLPVWAGWMVEADVPILLVVERDDDVDAIVQSLARTGFRRIAGYLAGGMTAWQDAGLPLDTLDQLPVHALRERIDRYTPLDVRSPAEWRKGHIPGALHVFLPELEGRIPQLARDATYAVYCDSGYRASIGASLLRRAGFARAANVPGSWQAWQHAGFPVET
ncbi:MAG TPA: MBL fold metallo-hydrolase [Casimicrobiaceae bacterium]|nr:MBL fold metallo-hydrolase [Casimicrobiaceae bacterium]